MQRLRKDLGISHQSAVAQWWESRIEDMLDLSCVEFAARHNVCADSVSIWRDRFQLPPLEHADAWYLEPANYALLTSESEPILSIARRFNRSVKTIWQIPSVLCRRHCLPV